MKKYLIMAMAAAAITSCSQDEVMEVAQKQAISFKDAFVENATRAAIDGSYTNAKGNLASFQVWGTTQDNASADAVNIFNGVEVAAKAGTDGKYSAPWAYAEQYTQYWIEGNAYKFIAIADGNVKVQGQSNGNLVNVTEVTAPDNTQNMPTKISIVNAEAQKDVLYAEVSTDSYPTGISDGTVSFTFNHILAKAKFTAYVDAKLDPKYYYTVSNIRIEEAAKNGVYTIEGKKWDDATTTYTVNFGNIDSEDKVTDSNELGCRLTAANAVSTLTTKHESDYDRLLIPETINKIKFDVKLYTANGLVNSYTEEIDNLELTVLGGKAYNLVFTLPEPGNKIKFTVSEITDWDTTHDDYTQDITDK